MQIAVVCIILVRVMGMLPALAGLATTLLLIPASSFVGRRLAKARKAVVGHTDARVKLTTEVPPLRGGGIFPPLPNFSRQEEETSFIFHIYSIIYIILSFQPHQADYTDTTCVKAAKLLAQVCYFQNPIK